METKVKNKIEFEFEGKKYILKRPSIQQKGKADLVHSKYFNEALKNGNILRDSLKDHCIQQGTITTEKQAEMLELLTAIEDNRKKLSDPNLDIEVGRGIAAQINIDVLRFTMMKWEEIKLDNVTVEGYADNQKFNYLVSACTYQEDGKPYFKDLNDYIERSEEEISRLCASKLSTLLYNLEENEEENRPENVYLKKLEALGKEEVIVSPEEVKSTTETEVVESPKTD